MFSRQITALIAPVTLVGCLATGVLADQLRPRVLPEKPTESTILPGFDRRHVEVKFMDGLDIGLSAAGVPFDRTAKVLKSAAAADVLETVASAGGRWQRMTADGESRMDELRATAEQFHQRAIADLNNYFILSVPENVTTEDWLDALNGLAEVELAQPSSGPG